MINEEISSFIKKRDALHGGPVSIFCKGVTAYVPLLGGSGSLVPTGCDHVSEFVSLD